MIILFSYVLILACPICSYNRVMPTWLLFVALRLLFVLTISLRRLDLVRTLGAFGLFEIAYYYAWRAAVWYSHPAVAVGDVAQLATGSFIVLSLGIPAALFLFGLSRMPYFRGAETVTLSWKRTLLLIPCMYAVAYAQGSVAYAQI